MNSTMQIKFGAGAENSIIASGDVVLLQKKKKHEPLSIQEGPFMDM